MGTGSATSVSIMCSIACGHPKVSDKNPVTTVQARKWSALSLGSGSPTGNSGISQPKKRSWVEVGLDVESVKSETGGWRQGVSSTLVGIQELLRE